MSGQVDGVEVSAFKAEPVAHTTIAGQALRVERIGDATLYLADCREILPTLAATSAVVTDPPYGINADKAAAHSSIRDNVRWPNNGWDKIRPDAAIIKIGNYILYSRDCGVNSIGRFGPITSIASPPAINGIPSKSPFSKNGILASVNACRKAVTTSGMPCEGTCKSQAEALVVDPPHLPLSPARSNNALNWAEKYSTSALSPKRYTHICLPKSDSDAKSATSICDCKGVISRHAAYFSISAARSRASAASFSRPAALFLSSAIILCCATSRSLCMPVDIWWNDNSRAIPPITIIGPQTWNSALGLSYQGETYRSLKWGKYSKTNPTMTMPVAMSPSNSTVSIDENIHSLEEEARRISRNAWITTVFVVSVISAGLLSLAFWAFWKRN